jgi:hypothetical protein
MLNTSRSLWYCVLVPSLASHEAILGPAFVQCTFRDGSAFRRRFRRQPWARTVFVSVCIYLCGAVNSQLRQRRDDQRGTETVAIKLCIADSSSVFFKLVVANWMCVDAQLLNTMCHTRTFLRLNEYICSMYPTGFSSADETCPTHKHETHTKSQREHSPRPDHLVLSE